MSNKRSIGVLLFEGFELLDVLGPLEMYGMAADHFDIRLVCEPGGVIASRQGPKNITDCSFRDALGFELLLVPGGPGTRQEVGNQLLLDWLRDQSQRATLVTSVCTGSALLAKAAVLDGVRATTNKMAFDWVTSQSSLVQWEKQAGWVEDGKFFSSTRVSAGIDMSLAVIPQWVSPELADQVATFAKLHGLVDG